MFVCLLVLFNFGRGLFGVCVCFFGSVQFRVGGCLVFVLLVLFNFSRGQFGVCLSFGSVQFWVGGCLVFVCFVGSVQF